MVRAKRAHNVETLKQPSCYLRLRAPYFYPDICKSGSVRGIEVPHMVEYCGTLDTERQEKQRKQIKPK